MEKTGDLVKIPSGTVLALNKIQTRRSEIMAEMQTLDAFAQLAISTVLDTLGIEGFYTVSEDGLYLIPSEEEEKDERK